MRFVTIQEPAGGEPGPSPETPASRKNGSDGLGLWMPLVLMGVIIYFMMIRPQRRQQKTREAMLAAIKKNDHVVTSGGIYGVVDKIREQDVFLKIDDRGEVRVRVLRSAIVGVDKKSGSEAETPMPQKEDVKR